MFIWCYKKGCIMNIFVLDNNLILNAQYHCDKHVVKMITEYNQLLCSAYYFTNHIPDNIYKLTHKNHPCAMWARESLSNWLWLRDMTLALCKEYTYRYGKIHKGETVCLSLPIPHIIDNGMTSFAQAMPEQYHYDNPVLAYRNYYLGEKRHLFNWKNRTVPEWVM